MVWMKPQVEQVSDIPSLAKPDYETRFTYNCRLTYSDNQITSIFEGTGVTPENHPLNRQFAMLRVPFAICGKCHSSDVMVIYAGFQRGLEDYSPQDIICDYEVFCQSCNVFSYRKFIM